MKQLDRDLIQIKKDPIKFATEISISKLVKLLTLFSDRYYNTGEALVSDQIYDQLVEYLKANDPENIFLKNVGAPIKGSKEIVKLPFQMGSLNKIKPDTGELEKWIVKYKDSYILSDKLDGASAQFYKDQMGKIFLFSRGNGDEGQDISHLIDFVIPKKAQDVIPNGVSIRGEMIISRLDFKKISDKMKNARNAISGLVNSKTVDKDVANIAQFVSYSILNPRYTQEEQMKLLTNWGFKVVTYQKMSKINEDILGNLLIERRKKSEFEIDGIVCVNNSQIFQHMGGFPDYAFAYKMILDDQVAIAKVVDVIWEPSMDGFLKPTIKIEPVELVGTTITYATAHNAKFVVDNKIGIGAKIKIIRSGDVIPYILEVVEPGEVQMPKYPYKWNKTNVDLVLKDLTGEAGQIVTKKIIAHFFRTIGVKHLGEGIIDKLVNNGYDSIFKILTANKDELSEIKGLGSKIVSNIFDEIDKAFESMELATFMSASHKFGRGLGEKKLAEIVETYPNILTQTWKSEEMKEKIFKIHGFSDISADLFTEKFSDFLKFYKEISKIKNISRFEKKEEPKKEIKDQLLSGQTIVFTGFRDKDMETFITKNGGKISTSVSKNTTILVHADGGDTSSSKFVKAKELGVQLMSKSEFTQKYVK